MEVLVLKKLIKEGIVDFDKLLKITYKDLGLSEMETFLLMELNALKVKGVNFVTPKILTKKLTITEEDGFALLEGLMNKKFLSFVITKNKNNKQTESFDIDATYQKIMDYYQSKIKEEMLTSENEYETLEEEIVELLEKNFQKQLTPIEVELIIKWVNEYKYTKEDIKEAIFMAVKAHKYSISYLDGVLLQKRQIDQGVKVRKTNKKKSAVLKEFLES